MGFNSAIFICNDGISQIEKDPAGWWEKCWENLSLLSYGETKDFGFGCHANGFEAIWNQHADLTGVVFLGGNYASFFGSSLTNSHHEEEKQIEIIKDILKQKGYSVSITKKK